MKAQIIYWIIIGVLLSLILGQITLNQPLSQPKLDNQNQRNVGRYQYFVDPNSRFGGFLDTEEGFAYVWIDTSWHAWDLKDLLESDFRWKFAQLSDTTKMRLTSEGKKQWLKELDETLDSKIKRIWK